MDHPYFIQKNLILGILAEMGVFLISLLLPRLLILLTDGYFDFPEFYIVTYPASVIFPFGIGFSIGYSAIKLLRLHYVSQEAKELKIESGVMSGYSQSQEQNANWFVWLFGSVSGFANLIVFTLLLEAAKKLF